MERTPNKSQHTKLTVEKKILRPLLPGFELATFRSRVGVGALTNKLSRLPNCACNFPVTWAAVVCLCGLTLCVLCFTVSRQWYGFHCMGLITVCTYVNVCDWGLYVHCRRVSTENCLLEKKLSPYQGVVSCICVSSVLDRCSTN